ncbi:MAG: cytochrome-c peroxidase [Flavobacteriaceae bacterium]
MKFANKLLVVFMIMIVISCNRNEEEVYEDISFDDTDVIAPDDGTILSNYLNLPTSSYNYANINLPVYFFNNNLRREDNTPNNNPTTNRGATLGRVLFYDKKMSANNTISCASCHNQADGFSDPNRFSKGFEGGLTGRNSMGLANARFYRNGNFFWDERANTLEDQVLMPIQDHVEMGMTLNALVPKLQNEEYYKILFRRTFGDENVTSERISKALAQFIRSMVSYESKYDEGLAQTNDPRRPFSNFTNSENLGKNLFFSNRTRCSDCHITNAFVGDRARNNGLDATITDEGLNNRGEFKTNSLRNIGLTAPYMHDGRFATLQQVVEHYNNGVRNSQFLDNRLRRGNGVRRLNLSPNERQALVDFLLTLTDNNFISDEKFSNPFKNK